MQRLGVGWVPVSLWVLATVEPWCEPWRRVSRGGYERDPDVVEHLDDGEHAGCAVWSVLIRLSLVSRVITVSTRCLCI